MAPQVGTLSGLAPFLVAFAAQAAIDAGKSVGKTGVGHIEANLGSRALPLPWAESHRPLTSVGRPPGTPRQAKTRRTAPRELGSRVHPVTFFFI